MADEAWQDNLLSTRHMHNRRGRGKNSNSNKAINTASSKYKTDGGGSGTGFDVQRMFATYSLRCPKAVTTAAPSGIGSSPSGPGPEAEAMTRGNVVHGARRGRRGANGAANDEGFLEIYRVTPDGQGLVGSFLLPVTRRDIPGSASLLKKKVKQERKQADVEFLEATVILAGSRKAMGQILSGVEAGSQSHDPLEATKGEILDPERQGNDDVDTREDGPASDDEHSRELERTGDSDQDDPSGSSTDHNDNEDDNDHNDHADSAGSTEDEQDGQEDRANRYQRPFEKNSFRSPKFWVEWRSSSSSSISQADPGENVTIHPGGPQEHDALETGGDANHSSPQPRPSTDSVLSGTGYLVFQGNDCRKFSGTISCPALGWDNLAASGHRLAGAGSRDVQALWPSNDLRAI
ncbi:uncharacterized protein B0I36DRAFT_363789 [Microdochium trichocladiopsis]|uniref:Uncharacterized protein n=1 Tax=Microdochium trichocladiopsis TaxID=1682393 RepID=A0A9P8Y6C6_9PEZI|nr:uncharacterized protein B0I36DRAFT_363789 [Microdochium trichocladiopsis]KAH7029218.1 hypothetical protein B0I36DRAFT_363789 [Microdochium trichocladiopsis]